MKDTKLITDKKVLLIGDTILDHYIYGTVIGTSAETPTLVAREQSETFSLGGAALVCRNLLELGAITHFITLVGQDRDAEVIKGFAHPKLTLHSFAEERQTTVKRRFWVDDYKLLQFDKLDNRPLSLNLEEAVISKVEELLSTVDCLIVSDYRHGLLTPSLIEKLLKVARSHKKPVYVDSQVSQSAANHHLYRGATLFCLNKKEAELIEKTADLQTIKKKLDALNIVVKRGAEGAKALIANQEIDSPGYRVDPVDCCGAGDAFLAALAVCDLSEPKMALSFANKWAALSTTIKGPQPPSVECL